MGGVERKSSESAESNSVTLSLGLAVVHASPLNLLKTLDTHPVTTFSTAVKASASLPRLGSMFHDACYFFDPCAFRVINIALNVQVYMGAWAWKM